MRLSKSLVEKGYSLSVPKQKDFDEYYQIKKKLCKKYTIKFFGGWDEAEQIKYNQKTFDESFEQTFFKKIVYDKQTIGFIGYTIFMKEIGCITIQILPCADRELLYDWFVSGLLSLAEEIKKPIFLKVFIGNSDLKLFQKYGFETFSSTQSHHLLKREKGEEMEKQEYVKFAKETFKGQEKKIVLEQIENFYDVKDKKVRTRKYKLGDNVILDKGIYMTGFKADKDYLVKISKEGKISGDFQGFPTRGGVKNAISLWKFDKRITLTNYITQYSGITAIWGRDNYEFVPYGKLDEFANRMKEEDTFMWFAESSRECRFLPSLARDTEQIALIFNMKNEMFKPILNNSCENLETCPTFSLKKDKRDPHNREINRLEDIFGARSTYPLFGIPRNCLEGIFVSRELENKEYLDFLKETFPDCYICNLDGKVIAI